MVTLLSPNPKRGARSKKSSAAHSGACTPGVAQPVHPGTLNALAVVTALEALQMANVSARVSFFKPRTPASGANVLRTSGTSTPVTCSSYATPPPPSPPPESLPQTPPPPKFVPTLVTHGQVPEVVGHVQQHSKKPSKTNPMFIPKQLQRRGINIPSPNKTPPIVVEKAANALVPARHRNDSSHRVQFQCSSDLLCNRVFADATALAHHERMHGYLVDHPKKDWPPGSVYLCPFGCGIPFFVHSPFKVHLERFHPLALEDFAADQGY